MHEAFSEFGEIKNIYMNLDRQTGFVKGYALIEYKTKREAQAAIDAMNGAELLTQNVVVDYAFKVGVLLRIVCSMHGPKSCPGLLSSKRAVEASFLP